MTAPTEALLLDMDGVLVDSEPLHMRTWGEVLKPLGIEVDRGWFDRWIGVPDRDLAAYITETYTQGMAAGELLAIKRERYETICTVGLSVMPGVADELRKLSSLPMAVVTSSTRVEAERSLRLSGLRPFFKALVSADDVAQTKPDPEPYAQAAERIGVPPARCIAIEDSPAGVQSARRAGCRVFAVTTTCVQAELSEAELVFESTACALAEAYDVIQPT